MIGFVLIVLGAFVFCASVPFSPGSCFALGLYFGVCLTLWALVPLLKRR